MAVLAVLSFVSIIPKQFRVNQYKSGAPPYRSIIWTKTVFCISSGKNKKKLVIFDDLNGVFISCGN